MRTLIIAALVTILAVPAFAAGEPKLEDQKTFYALGLALARQLSVFSLTPAEMELVKQGFADATSGTKPAVDLDAYTPKIQELAQMRFKAQGDKLAASSKEFLDTAAKEKGAVKTGSGLIYLSLKEGTGATPSASVTPSMKLW